MRNWGSLKGLSGVVGSTVVVAGFIMPSVGLAKVHLSDLPASEGRSSESSALLHKHIPLNVNALENSGEDLANKLGGFNELIPYVLASPDQEDAGSCLYMAITGLAE